MTADTEGLAELPAALAGLCACQPRRTLAQLATQTGLLERTLTELVSGTRPLSWEVTCAYVTACGGDKDEFRALWERAVGAMDRPQWQKRNAAGQVTGRWDRHDPVGRLPDPFGATTAADLGGQLAKLKTWANAALKELEARTWPKVSDTTLSELLNNHRALTADRARGVATACGLPPWEADRWAEAVARFEQVTPPGPPAVRRPGTGARVDGRKAPIWLAAVLAPARHAGTPLRAAAASPLWLGVAATIFITGAVCGGAVVALHRSPRADFVYLRYPQPVTVTPADPANFYLSRLPSRDQDWYLDLRLHVGYTSPLANCISEARFAYRIEVGGKSRRSGTSQAGQTDVSATNVHVGPGGTIHIVAVLHDPAGCTLTLDPTGTVARPAR